MVIDHYSYTRKSVISVNHSIWVFWKIAQKIWIRVSAGIFREGGWLSLIQVKHYHVARPGPFGGGMGPTDSRKMRLNSPFIIKQPWANCPWLIFCGSTDFPVVSRWILLVVFALIRHKYLSYSQWQIGVDIYFHIFSQGPCSPRSLNELTFDQT